MDSAVGRNPGLGLDDMHGQGPRRRSIEGNSYSYCRWLYNSGSTVTRVLLPVMPFTTLAAAETMFSRGCFHVRGACTRRVNLAELSSGPRSTRRLFSADVLPSLISPASSDFIEKKEAMDTLVNDLESKLSHARQGGGVKATERMRKKGKMLPRER